MIVVHWKSGGGGSPEEKLSGVVLGMSGGFYQVWHDAGDYKVGKGHIELSPKSIIQVDIIEGCPVNRSLR
jgi:hypothetical protein